MPAGFPNKELTHYAITTPFDHRVGIKLRQFTYITRLRDAPMKYELVHVSWCSIQVLNIGSRVDTSCLYPVLVILSDYLKVAHFCR